MNLLRTVATFSLNGSTAKISTINYGSTMASSHDDQNSEEHSNLLMTIHIYLTHSCQLSRIIWESPGYRTNLPVSRTGHPISRIKSTLNPCTTVSERPVPKFTKSKQCRFLKLAAPFLEQFFKQSLTTKPHVDGY